MSKTRSIAVAVTLVGVTLAFSAMAADTGGPASRRYAGPAQVCQNIWRCGPGGCNWHQVCAPVCPDGSSCTPLYGAYGPYGGEGYWGAYTDSGWRYFR
jgi:hypothetical protein